MKRTVEMGKMTPGVGGFSGRHGVTQFIPKNRRSIQRRYYRNSLKTAQEKLDAAIRVKNEKLTADMLARVDEFKAKLASLKPMAKTFLKRATGRG